MGCPKAYSDRSIVNGISGCDAPSQCRKSNSSGKTIDPGRLYTNRYERCCNSTNGCLDDSYYDTIYAGCC